MGPLIFTFLVLVGIKCALGLLVLVIGAALCKVDEEDGYCKQTNLDIKYLPRIVNVKY